MCGTVGWGKAPLTVVPRDWGGHSLSLAQKLNAPLKPEWWGRGRAGVLNDWCINFISHSAIVWNST